MSSHSEFLKQLQRYTAEAAITPAAVRNQGAPGVARAARAYLATSEKLLPMLEVPLDSHVAGRLRGKPEGRELPRWKSVKRLGYKRSAGYQHVAQQIANRMNLRRADLDVYFWRADRK
jgi:hypothetical protein